MRKQKDNVKQILHQQKMPNPHFSSEDVSTKALLFTFAMITFLLFILPILITMLIGNFQISEEKENEKDIYLTEKTKVDYNRKNERYQKIIINIENNGEAKEKNSISVLIEVYKKDNELIASKNVSIEETIGKMTVYETNIEIDIGSKREEDIYYKITLFYNGKEVDLKIIS